MERGEAAPRQEDAGQRDDFDAASSDDDRDGQRRKECHPPPEVLI